MQWVDAERGTGWEVHHHNLAMLHGSVDRHLNCCLKNTSWCYSAGETIALFDPDFSNDIGQ